MLANSPTLSGTLTVSGSGAEQLNLTQTSGGSTFQLASNGGVANLSNYYSGGNMTFGIQSGGVYGWYVNGAAAGTLGATGLSVSNTIQSTSGGFKFPDSTVQTTAAVTTFDVNVRQTVMSGDNSGGAPTFLTTGTGLTPAYTATTPLVIEFAGGTGATGLADSISSLSSGGSLSALPANETEYLYATYASPTSVTWGSNLATPQYGSFYNQYNQLSLQLNNTSLDDFGATWTNTSVTFGNSSPHVTGAYYGIFSGTSTMKIANFNSLFPTGSNGFTVRAWAKATSLAAISTILGGATSGTSGPLIMGVNSSGKSLLYLSSVGASWDIASGTTGTVTIATGTWHYYELTYDPIAGKYYYYIDGTLDQTVNTSTKALASMAYGGGMQVGLWTTIDGWNGNIAGVEYLPYCLHPAGTTYTVPTAVGSLNNGVPLSDWFDTINFVMKTPSAASASAGANPTFTTSKKVYVGEAATGASSVTSVTPYALNGYYDSGWTFGLPTYSTAVAKTSNMGVAEQVGTLVIEDVVADGTFSPGDRFVNPAPANNSSNAGVGFVFSRNTMTLATGSAGTNEWGVVSKTGGAVAALTIANWKWKLVSKRSFQ